LPRDFELRGCQLQNFIQRLLLRLHCDPLGVSSNPPLRKIRLRVGALHEFLQSSFNCRLGE
jgi:hypothetical protein